MSNAKPNPTPKDNFLASPKAVIGKHVAMVQSDSFQLAKDTALLEYSRRLCNQQAQDQGSAASFHLRMLGAQEIISIMLTLHLSPTVAPPSVAETNLSTNRAR